MTNFNFEFETLKNLAYNFYPQHLSPEEEDYHNSPEFKALIKVLGKPHQVNSSLKNIFQDKVDAIFEDCTHETFLDRAFNWQYYEVKEGQIATVSVYISKIIPYYIIKNLIVKTDIKSNWLSLPKINQSPSSHVQNISQRTDTVLTKTLNLKKVPHTYENTIIENIEFQEIRKGKFTFFNAFFLDQYFIK